MMKNRKLIPLMSFSICLALFAGCSGRVSTEELTVEVKKSMEEYFAQNEVEVEITSLILTHKSENEYKGVLSTVEPEGNFDYTVEIIYDGENMTWEILE
jgi:hypothetical protein